MIQKNKNKNVKLFSLVVLFIILTAIVIAQPEGAQSINIINTSRRNPTAARSTDAQAGNVTQINLVGSTVTQTWQGYVGNVSGTITLDDSSDFTLYNWSLSAPEGEVYAAAGEIDFSSGNIECYNYSKSGGSYKDLATYEASLGLESDDADGVNETFTPGTTYNEFYAGLNHINTECPETQLFNSSGTKSASQYQEVLLYDLNNNLVIYTSLINNNYQGYNGQSWDFQMIVGEDGHNGDNSVTTYYFYVELE